MGQTYIQFLHSFFFSPCILCLRTPWSEMIHIRLAILLEFWRQLFCIISLSSSDRLNIVIFLFIFFRWLFSNGKCLKQTSFVGKTQAQTLAITLLILFVYPPPLGFDLAKMKIYFVQTMEISWKYGFRAGRTGGPRLGSEGWWISPFRPLFGLFLGSPVTLFAFFSPFPSPFWDLRLNHIKVAWNCCFQWLTSAIQS